MKCSLCDRQSEPEPHVKVAFSKRTLMPPAQVDLAQEGRHLWQFNYNFRHDPHVRFPFPIYPLVSPQVSASARGTSLCGIVGSRGRR